MNVNGTFVLPFGAGHKWLTSGSATRCSAAGRSRWRHVFRTAFPVSVWQSNNNSGLLGSSQRPNVVPGVELATSGSLEERLTNWINPAAFTAAPATPSATRRGRCRICARPASATSISASRRSQRSRAPNDLGEGGRVEPLRQPALHDAVSRSSERRRSDS